jgi:hypothetical protein
MSSTAKRNQPSQAMIQNCRAHAATAVQLDVPWEWLDHTHPEYNPVAAVAKLRAIAIEAKAKADRIQESQLTREEAAPYRQEQANA